MRDQVEIVDNAFLRQFELEIGDNMARIEYALQERKIFITKFDMCQELLDQGFKEIFIKAVFEEVKNRGISLVPTSPEIAHFFKKNRRIYKPLLPIGMNI